MRRSYFKVKNNGAGKSRAAKIFSFDHRPSVGCAKRRCLPPRLYNGVGGKRPIFPHTPVISFGKRWACVHFRNRRRISYEFYGKFRTRVRAVLIFTPPTAPIFCRFKRPLSFAYRVRNLFHTILFIGNHPAHAPHSPFRRGPRGTFPDVFFLNARNRPVGNFPLRFKHSGSQRIELVCSSLFWFIGLPSSARLPPISMFTYIISDVSALVNTLFKNFSQNM